MAADRRNGDPSLDKDAAHDEEGEHAEGQEVDSVLAAELDALLDEAHAALEAGNLEAAADSLAKLQVHAPDASAVKLLEAHLAAAAGEYETALECAEAASEDGDPIALLAYASLIVELTGDTGTAVLVLEEAADQVLDLDREDDEDAAVYAALEAEIYALLAQCRLVERDVEGAHRAAVRAVDLDGTNADAHAQLAASLLDLGQLDEAEASARKAHELDPEDPARAYGLALLLRLRGDRAGADVLFGEAAALDPEDFPRPVALSRPAVERALDEVTRKAPQLLATYFKKLRALPLELVDAVDVKRAIAAGVSPLKAVALAGPDAEEAEAEVPLQHMPTAAWVSLDAVGALIADESELEACLTALLAEEVGAFLGFDDEEGEAEADAG